MLLDGILVATANRTLRDAWTARLRRNERKFAARVKVTAAADLTAGSNFAGVVFTPQGWGPRAHVAVGSTDLVQSKRQLARRLGSALWAVNVRGAGDPGRRGLLQHSKLLELMRLVGGCTEDLVNVPAELISALASLENQLARSKEESWTHVPTAPYSAS